MALVVNQAFVLVGNATVLIQEKLDQARNHAELLRVKFFAYYDDSRLPSFEEAMSLIKTKKQRAFIWIRHFMC